MKSPFLKYIICALIVVTALSKVDAKHIVGGDLIYTCLGIDSSNLSNIRVLFEFTLNMYRDGYQAGETLTPFDPEGIFGIYLGDGEDEWRFVETLDITIGEQEVPIPITEDPCAEIPENIEVDRGTYVFRRWFDVSDETYMIAFQRCCRNNTISNIYEPEASGSVIYVEISPEAQRSCNNSPSFTDFPPILICTGNKFEFDHSATDMDGDSLIYSFCTPWSAGGRIMDNRGACNSPSPNPENCLPPFARVAYRTPTFSTNMPVPGNPALTVHAATGLISGRPNLTGQFVVGICVTEVRNGEVIGKINRDFQFNVTVCDPLVNAGIRSDAKVGDREFVLNSCGENTITFLNESVDENFIQSYKWEFDIRGTPTFFTTRDATVTFPGIGLYNGKMIINEGTDCVDSASISVNVYPDLSTDFTFDYDTCVAGAVLFEQMSVPAEDNIITNWDWDFAGQGASVERNPDFFFDEPGLLDVTLTVTDNNQCTASQMKTVDWRPVPQVLLVEPSSFVGCNPASIKFNNLSSPIDSTYNIQWDFGDGGSSTDISPSHIYNEIGTYDVSVKIESPIGCAIGEFFPNFIRIDSKPKADFDFSPDRPNVFNNTLDFEDRSVDAVAWKWNFNGESNAFDPNPSYTFQDTGVQVVELVVTHPSSCTDTIVKLIDIEPVATLFMPNAFTPNGDFENDVFKGKGFSDVFVDYNMSIWTRWGELVFETDDPVLGWNGRKNNSGQELPTGVYVYKVVYQGPRGAPVELKGFATLVR